MELEELKNRWASLEDQLKKQEIMNEKLVQEIRQSKSGPLGKLIRYGYLGIGVMTVGLAVMIYFLKYGFFNLFISALYVGALLFVAGSLITAIYNMIQLYKIDFTQSVSENMQLVGTYKVNIKKQTLFVYLIATLIIAGSIISMFFNPNVEPWRWWALAGLPVVYFIGYLEYKKIFKANIDAILRSLEELKELEEEE